MDPTAQQPIQQTPQPVPEPVETQQVKRTLLPMYGLGVLVLVIIGIVLFFSFYKKSSQNNNGGPAGQLHIQKQQPFKVLTTSPENNATNVGPGEISISFTTDIPVIDKNVFSLSLSPQPTIPLSLTSQFPTTKITEGVLGGLKINTTYTATVKNAAGQSIYSWSFSTPATASGQSSSGLIQKQEQQYVNSKLPLFQFVPYQNDDFYIDYTGDLTLEVDIRNPDVAKVKQEVTAWIKSHGVDPATHTINYQNDF